MAPESALPALLHSLMFILPGAFAAAVLRGFTGFGFVMTVVPLLSLVLPPAQVVPLALLLQILVSMLDLRAAMRIADWRSLRWLAPGMVVGTPVGIVLLTRLSPSSARLAIGALIVASVIALARGVRLPAHPPRWMTFAAGIISGAMNGLSGMSGPPVMAYLLALPHSMAVVRASAIVFFIATASIAAVPMAVRGLIGEATVIAALAALPVLFIGSRLGAWGFSRTGARTHRRVAFAVLLCLATLLISRGLAGAWQ